MRKSVLVALFCLSALAVAQDPNQPVRPRHPSSRRVQRNYSPEELEAQRESSRLKAEQLAAERKARREKLAAEYAEMETPPAQKTESLARPYFIFGGIVLLALAAMIAVYKKFLEGG